MNVYVRVCVCDSQLVELEGHDPFAANAHGMTPLHYAVLAGNVHIVHYLVRRH
jgi:ankyrin repeat protein